MSSRLTRSAYEHLIDEDVARVVAEMAPSPERDHVMMVLRASPSYEYSAERAEAAKLKLTQYRVVPNEESNATHAHPWHSPRCYEAGAHHDEKLCTCGLTALREDCGRAESQLATLREAAGTYREQRNRWALAMDGAGPADGQATALRAAALALDTALADIEQAAEAYAKRIEEMGYQRGLREECAAWEEEERVERERAKQCCEEADKIRADTSLEPLERARRVLMARCDRYEYVPNYLAAVHDIDALIAATKASAFQEAAKIARQTARSAEAEYETEVAAGAERACGDILAHATGKVLP